MQQCNCAGTSAFLKIPVLSWEICISSGEQFNWVWTHYCGDITKIIYLFICEIYFNPCFSVEKPKGIKGLMSLCAIHGQMNILTLLFNDPYGFLNPGPYILPVPRNVGFNDISESCKQHERWIGSFINYFIQKMKLDPSGQRSISTGNSTHPSPQHLSLSSSSAPQPFPPLHPSALVIK